MDEIFPVLAGVLLGVIIAGIDNRRFRVGILLLAGIALGITASWISGELQISAWYALIDCAQVVGAAVMIAVLVRMRSRRGKRLA
jgi:MFS-type transporter involved in bile tolerance (Atg22 family)